MRKIIIILAFSTYLFNLGAQSIEDKVEALIVADGTMRSIEELIDGAVDYQKTLNPMIPEKYWLALNDDIKKEALPDFIKLVTPIYKLTFKEEEIDRLYEFYNSEIGNALVDKSPKLIQDLNLPIMQWSQNLNSNIIEKVENRGKDVPHSDEIEEFEQRIKKQFGLQILNMNELTIDKENNPGTLLIDFGETNGTLNIEKEIIVKNNTDSLLTFEEPFHLLNDDITLDWDKEPLKPKEKRALKFTLNAKVAEGNRYSSMSIMVNHGNGLNIGVKYIAPHKEIEYSISADSIAFEPFEGKFSKEYLFKLKNTGEKPFRIMDVKLDKSIAYMSYDNKMISPEEEVEIKFLFEKNSLPDGEKTELDITVFLTKSEDQEYHHFFNKKFNLKIK